MFTETDLNLVRDRAISKSSEIPARCRLKGMTRDLTQSEIRTAAFYEAAVITAFEKLGRKLTDEELALVYPSFYQEILQVIEGHDVSYNAGK